MASTILTWQSLSSTPQPALPGSLPGYRSPEWLKKPKVVKKPKSERPPEKYLQHGVFKRFIYWLAWLFPSGFIIFIACAGSLEDPLDGTVFAVVVFFSVFFFLAEWRCFDRLAHVSKKDFAIEAFIIPMALLVGLIPGLQSKPVHIAMLLLACLAIGLIQQAGLRKIHLKISRYFFLYFCIAFSVCLIPVLIFAGDQDFYGEIFWICPLVFPIFISKLLALFIHPGIFPPEENYVTDSTTKKIQELQS